MAKKACEYGEIRSEGKCVLPIVMRKWGKDNGGGVVALMPTLPSDEYGWEMTSYEHIGQHGGAVRELMSITTPAKPKEYRSLLKELKRRDYKHMKVYRKITAKMDNVRMELAEEDRKRRMG